MEKNHVDKLRSGLGKAIKVAERNRFGDMDLKSKSIFGIAVIGVIGISAYLTYKIYRRFKTKDVWTTYTQRLGRKIVGNYWKNASIVKFRSSCGRVVSGDITFEVNRIENLDAKPTAWRQHTTDPFCPPFNGTYIQELSDTHRLLYNQYSLVPYHTLVITKTMEYQNQRLNYKDFEGCIQVMKAMNGFSFYNSGQLAGASQPHKHLQSIPLNSLPNRRIPIDANIKKEIKKLQKDEFLFRLPSYRFRHVVCAFKQDILKNLKGENVISTAKLIRMYYEEMLLYLNNSNLKYEYNLIFTTEWAMIVLRQREMAFDRISINALAFSGSILVKTLDDDQFVKLNSPISLLTDVAFSE